jgi:hypothetical protein
MATTRVCRHHVLLLLASPGSRASDRFHAISTPTDGMVPDVGSLSRPGHLGPA